MGRNVISKAYEHPRKRPRKSRCVGCTHKIDKKMSRMANTTVVREKLCYYGIKKPKGRWSKMRGKVNHLMSLLINT